LKEGNFVVGKGLFTMTFCQKPTYGPKERKSEADIEDKKASTK